MRLRLGVATGLFLFVLLWLYLWGAGATVLVSFVPISLFAGRDARSGRTYSYPRFDLLRIGALRASLGAHPLIFGLRALSVALFMSVVLAGLFGAQSVNYNLAPTFVWILWWVGLSFFTAFVGNVWPLLSPWKILFDWTDAFARRLRNGRGLELCEPYPDRWGVWPAVVLYAAFVWIELVFSGAAVPRSLAFLILAYSALTWGGMSVFGRHAWQRGGEAFFVYFDLLGRFAPTEVGVKPARACRGCEACAEAENGCAGCYECFEVAPPGEREICLRPPAAGLARPEPLPAGGVVFVILVLAGVAFDGLLDTPLWLEILRLTPVTPTLGLLVTPALFLGFYLGFVALSRLSGGGGVSFGSLASSYVLSLVPIAIAYQVAHYYTYLLIQGQTAIALFSDPLGRGWDLFGTADYETNVGVVDAAFVWYSQVALIVGGHVVAVYLAHAISLRLFGDPKRALRSQYPMLLLMILYTVSSLWIVSQPIVGE
jgi:hypothetical protein